MSKQPGFGSKPRLGSASLPSSVTPDKWLNLSGPQLLAPHSSQGGLRIPTFYLHEELTVRARNLLPVVTGSGGLGDGSASPPATAGPSVTAQCVAVIDRASTTGHGPH